MNLKNKADKIKKKRKGISRSLLWTVLAVLPAFSIHAEVPLMSLSEYPIVDCSLACVPLCEAMAKTLTGCSDIEAENSIKFSNTNQSYEALSYNIRDLIISYEASDHTKEYIRNFSSLDLQPVGKDALVFLVNAGNPLDSLSSAQLYDIFTGRITNWKEVGGEDLEIKVFQRQENSGSKTLLRTLLIGDAEMVDGPFETVYTMDDIFDSMRQYDNEANSIGYSVYYYADQMMDMDEIKILRVDDILPSNETIGSGEYPLVHPFYCGTNNQSSKNALKIKSWLLSDEGQDFVESCGYVRYNPVSP